MKLKTTTTIFAATALALTLGASAAEAGGRHGGYYGGNQHGYYGGPRYYDNNGWAVALGVTGALFGAAAIANAVAGPPVYYYPGPVYYPAPVVAPPVVYGYPAPIVRPYPYGYRY